MTQQTAPPGAGRTATKQSAPQTAPDPTGAAVSEDLHLASPRLRLDRLSTVRARTVVVLIRPGAGPILKRPGELMIPGWTPWRRGPQVVVVNTEPVRLHVEVEQLRTLDGESLARVELDVLVRLSEAALPELVVTHEDLEAALASEVRRSVESSVRAAVGMNRALELRRRPLTPMLQNRWMPRSMLDGAVLLEDFTVRRVHWSSSELELPRVNDADRAGDDDTLVFDLPQPEAPPLTLGNLGREDRHAKRRAAETALEYVYVPAVISVMAFWLFFTAHWVPEFQSFPGARFVLEQLAPLASKELTSGGQPLVASQAGHSGAAAAYLLFASLLFAPLARSRYWLARLVLWPLTYAAAIAATVSVLGVVLRGRLGADLLGVLLLVVWVLAAGITTWRSLWVDIDDLPLRPAGVVWLLGVFALVNPVPVALGRALFAPELRTAALEMVDNSLSLRWPVLLAPATAWVYLSGLLLGVLYWACYLLWPPRRTRKATLPVVALVGAVVGVLVIGPQAADSAARRLGVVRTQSPAADLSFTCGSWTQEPSRQPVQTLVVAGLGCGRLVAFSGYREVASRDFAESLSRVDAETFAGEDIDGRVVGAQYGPVVSVAAVEPGRGRPTVLLGLRVSDAAELWRFRCPPRGTVKLRFAGVPTGDDAASGRQTLRGERPGVLVDCGGRTVRLDPRTGRPS